MTDGGEGISGWHHSEETKQKIRIGHLEKPFSEEHKINLSVARRGKLLSKKHRKNIGLGNLGKHNYLRSEEEKKRLRTVRVGQKQTEETKKKISQSQKIKFRNKKKEMEYANL